MIRVETAKTHQAQQSCLAIRRAVFIVEQAVSEPDELDGLDDQATHLIAFWDGDAAGTLRLRRIDDTAKIERVCVLKAYRRKGLADALTEAALREIDQWPDLTLVKLSAQVPVVPFYERHGFKAEGPVYDDAGIPHRDMTRPVSAD